jgi:hypothetical protein
MKWGYIVNLVLISNLLESSQNLPVVDDKTSKAMTAAALMAVIAVPPYMYYRWSSANQKEIQTVTQKIHALQSQIQNKTTDLQSIKNGDYQPLPQEYYERKKAAIAPRSTRANDVQYQRDYAEFQKFITKFAPPSTTQNDLMKNEQLIYDNPAVYNSKQDNFFVKMGSDFSRIVNRERMQKLIVDNKLKHITVPNKYIFFIGDEFFNIADKMKPYEAHQKLCSKEEIEELANFIADIGYADFVGQNIFKSANGQWVFIDTEDAAFSMSSCQDQINNLKGLKDYIGIQHMDPNAQKWLTDKISILERNMSIDSSKHCEPELTKRTELDDRNIDMNAAKRYAGGLNSRRTTRSLLFGNNPFQQKTVVEIENQLQNEIMSDKATLDLF